MWCCTAQVAGVGSCPFARGRSTSSRALPRPGSPRLIEITDYCLGSSSCAVPEGVIRRTVEWYGLRLQLQDGQVFVARRAPARGATSSTDVFYAAATEVAIPESGGLQQTTNVDAATRLLSAAVGIGANVHEPPPGQTRPALSANVRHALAFVFQPQDEIIRRQHLFHQQSDNWVAQAIKDTLPYFLGAVDEEHVAKKEELRRLRKQLRDRERRLETMESVRGQGPGQSSSASLGGSRSWTGRVRRDADGLGESRRPAATGHGIVSGGAGCAA